MNSDVLSDQTLLDQEFEMIEEMQMKGPVANFLYGYVSASPLFHDANCEQLTKLIAMTGTNLGTSFIRDICWLFPVHLEKVWEERPIDAIPRKVGEEIELTSDGDNYWFGFFDPRHSERVIHVRMNVPDGKVAIPHAHNIVRMVAVRGNVKVKVATQLQHVAQFVDSQGVLRQGNVQALSGHEHLVTLGENAALDVVYKQYGDLEIILHLVHE